MAFIKGDFLKSLVVLLSGTVIAQLINLIFIPILHRVYDPEELGLLNFYLQIVTFITAGVTLRLELSLPLERYDAHRYRLFRYALRWALLFSFIAFVPLIIVVVANEFDPIMNWVLLLIPIGILLHALFNLGMYWELGQNGFKRITYAKLTRASSFNFLKWGAGLMHWGALGLILSVLLGMLVSVSVYAKSLKRAFRSFTYSSKSKKTKYLVNKHRDFYFFNLPHTMVDITRDVVLAAFIMSQFDTHDYGSFSTSFAVLRLPLAFVGEAIGQAMFAKCSTLFNEKKPIGPFITKLILGLTGVALFPFISIYFYGTEIFTFVLGDNWVDAGTFSEIITWWLMVIFIASPLSFIPIVLNRQQSYFMINILRTICLVCAVYIPVYLYPSITLKASLGIIAMTQVSINLILILYYVIIIRNNDKQLTLQ